MFPTLTVVTKCGKRYAASQVTWVQGSWGEPAHGVSFLCSNVPTFIPADNLQAVEFPK